MGTPLHERLHGEFCCEARRRQASLLGRAALTEAMRDIGKGEELRNNAGPYVWSLTGRETSGPWCAAAVWTWLARGARRLRRLPIVPRIHGARRLCAAVVRAGGRPTTDPLPGDLVLWARRGGHHIGIVESVTGWRFTAVEGNRGSFPARVEIFPHSATERHLVGAYRLP